MSLIQDLHESAFALGVREVTKPFFCYEGTQKDLKAANQAAKDALKQAILKYGELLELGCTKEELEAAEAEIGIWEEQQNGNV
jgi:hypothetical protein